jgi:rod shape-determining protein MreD
MKTDTLKRIATLLVFLIAQVLLLDYIHLLGVATPLLYVYFILQFPYQHPKWSILLWGFAMGLSVDIFTNTPGVAAASLTAIAAIQPYYLGMFMSRDVLSGFKPSIKSLGELRYSYYAIPLVLLYCMLFFTFEQFSFFNPLRWIACVVGSAAITLALIFTFETAKKK